MKIAIFYASPDMYTHECEYIRTNKMGSNTVEDLWTYYMSEWGASRAACKMYVFDPETMTTTLVMERTLPLKVKIVINGKVGAPKTEGKKYKPMFTPEPINSSYWDVTINTTQS